LHEADLDVLVTDLGLARLEPVRVLEADRDLGAAFGEREPGDEGAHQRRHQRNQPHDRRAPSRRDDGVGDVVEPGIDGSRVSFAHAPLARLRSQMSRGSKDSAASMVSTTTAPKNTAPASARIVASEPSRTSATRIVTTKMSTIDQRPIASVSRYRRVRSSGRQ